MEKKLIFLLYDARSGSTLLSALLNRYKGISVSQESTFIHRIIEYRYPIVSKQIEDVFHRLLEEVQFTEFDLNTEEIITTIKKNRKDSVSKKELIEFILKDYFNKRDPEADFWVIKQGDYLYMKEILEMFPHSTFLQIVRDGRAVFHSKKNTSSFAGEPQDTNPLHAAWNWTQKLKKAEFYHKKVVTIRYEDLLENTDTTLEDLLDRLNVSQRLRKITKTRKKYFYEMGDRQKPLHQNVKREPQPHLADKWKQGLAEKEIKVFTYWAGNYLTKYRYETQKYSRAGIYYSSFRYLMTYLYQKSINILKLLNTPNQLRIKLKRKFRMFINR